MKKTTFYYALIGVMSGVAFVLYALEVPTAFIFPAAPYLKIDFSDIPAVFTGIVAGPMAGVLVQIIKNILHVSITKEPSLSGEIANLFAGVAFMLPVVFAFRIDPKKWGILGLIAGTLSATIIMVFVNLFITLPLYGVPQEVRWDMIVTIFTPFNLLRGALFSFIILLIYPAIKPYLVRYRIK